MWWRTVLLVDETRVPGENHRPAATRCVHHGGYDNCALVGKYGHTIFQFLLSNSAHTTRFWNSIHYVRSNLQQMVIPNT
jgi:hypothetical protein